MNTPAHEQNSPAELETLVEAGVELRRLVRTVRPSDLGLPTPCPRYDVRGLLEHVIGWRFVFAACAAGDGPPIEAGSPTYRLTAGAVRDLESASTRLYEGLRSREDGTIDAPYRGTIPVLVLVSELVAETVIHTCDLAIALAEPVGFDAPTVTAAHAGLDRLVREPFAAEAFGPTAEAGPMADDLTRLLRRSGRAGSLPPDAAPEPARSF